jgi:hypothetical protein
MFAKEFNHKSRIPVLTGTLRVFCYGRSFGFG